jgi:hypothetical protein
VDTKVVAIAFLGRDDKPYDWCLIKIPCMVVNSGKTIDHVTQLDLDHIFDDRDTSIRLKGYTQNGRPLYVETNKIRTKPRNLTKRTVCYYTQTYIN